MMQVGDVCSLLIACSWAFCYFRCIVEGMYVGWAGGHKSELRYNLGFTEFAGLATRKTALQRARHGSTSLGYMRVAPNNWFIKKKK